MKKTLIFLLVGMFCCGCARAIDYGEQQGVLGFPGDYLATFSANARALGMGGAYTALSDDASGPYWNPSGLADMGRKEISFMYSPLYMDAGFSFVGYAHPLAKGKVIGTSIAGLWCGDIEKMTALGQSNGTFSDIQMAYFISYAQSLNEKFNMGLNFKIVHQKIDVYSDMGYGLDVGLLYKPVNFLSFGASLQNVILQPQLRLKDEIDVFPVNLKTGFAVKLFDDKLIWLGDMNVINLWPDKTKIEGITVPTPFTWHTGIEYKVFDLFQLRGGISYKEITCGVGVLLRSFDFQYATSFHQMGITHRVTLVAKFGLIPTAQEEELIKKEGVLDAREDDLRIEAVYQEAFESYSEGDLKKADALIEKVFVSQPDHKGAAALKKKIEQRESKGKALVCLENAARFLKANKTEEAIEAMKEAQMLDPGCKARFEQQQLDKAKEYLALKKYKNAEEILAKILILDPDNEEAKGLLQRLVEMKEFIN